MLWANGDKQASLNALGYGNFCVFMCVLLPTDSFLCVVTVHFWSVHLCFRCIASLCLSRAFYFCCFRFPFFLICAAMSLGERLAESGSRHKAVVRRRRFSFVDTELALNDFLGKCRHMGLVFCLRGRRGSIHMPRVTEKLYTSSTYTSSTPVVRCRHKGYSSISIMWHLFTC